MGSERLAHMFTAKDPTFKGTSSAAKREEDATTTHHSMSHTSGTQPVSVSNGPHSSSSSIFKGKRKHNPKYEKLLKLHGRQLTHIGKMLHSIESFSHPSAADEKNEFLLSNKKRIEQLNVDLEDLRHRPTDQDHEEFQQMKSRIDQVIDDLKSYKMHGSRTESSTVLDLLVGYPLEVSDSEETDKDNPAKTLVYF